MKLTYLQKILFGLGISVGVTGMAYGSAFQLFDQDASQLGNDYAGSVASANTAGTEFYNAAGMTHLKRTTLSFGGTVINTNIAFDGITETGTPADHDLQDTGYGVAKGGGTSVVPNFHLVVPLSDRWAFGFGMTVPFGLQTDYNPASTASMAATTTSLRAINIGPSLAYQVNNWFSVGGGIDEQRALGVFDQSPSLFGVDRMSIHNQLSDWATGWHLGALFDLSNTQRIGVNYRSKVNHKAKGTSTAVSNDDMEGGSNTNVSTQIVLPPTTSIGWFDDVNDKWTLLAKADYTQWHTIKSIDLDNVEIVVPFAGPAQANIALPQNFKNTWNLAVGADYHISKAWMWKLGGGWDQSPVNNTDRNVRLPDNDHYILSTGVNYAPNDNFTIDLGYEHVFLKKANINNTSALGSPALTLTQIGAVTASADIFGAQLSWKF